MKTCVNRFLGHCPKCKHDYDPNHKPNNLDCPRYKEIEIVIFEVKEENDGKSK